MHGPIAVLSPGQAGEADGFDGATRILRVVVLEPGKGDVIWGYPGPGKAT
jgi:hypothetical protein